MDRFKSPDSKLTWAHEHLTTLDAKFSAYGKDHPYKPVTESHPEHGQAIRFPLSSVPPMPDEFSHRIGEFATALRASLDHLMWALMTGTPKNSNKIQFPIFDNPTRYQSEWPKQLSGVIPTAEPIISDLQPHKAPQPHAHPLWRIHRLSNTDKHRIIVLAPHAIRFSFALGPPGGQRAGLVVTLGESHDEDPIIPLPAAMLEAGSHFDFQIEALFAVVLKNADIDTGIFMTMEELPTLYDFVRDKVFPQLKALIA